jgi:hypothetical protein
MRCKKCDYRLWGIVGRECPECGTHFVPSQYEFTPNSVRFGCPHCGQDYYGTTERGHLDPFEFDCVRCGRHVHMDEMTVFPTVGLEEEQTEVDRMPWLDRRRIGFVRAWFRTALAGAFSPTRLMRLTPVDSSLGEAAWFVLLNSTLAALLGMLPLFIFPMIVVGRAGLAAGAGGLLVSLVLLLWPLIMVAIWGTFAHAILLATGHRAHGLGRTWQAMCYSSAPNLVAAVPCLGVHLSIVAWIWWSVTAILAVREAQRVSGARASLAVLTLPICAVAGAVCLIIWVVVPGFRDIQAQSAAAMRRANVMQVATALHTYATQHNGKPPAHASALIASGTAATAFCVPNADWTSSQPSVGGTNVQGVSAIPMPQSAASLTGAASVSLPAKVIAHRVGDCVFVYHGIDFNQPDPGLWTVILMPAQTSSPAPATVEVGLVYGMTTSIPASGFTQALTAQNKLRASRGLAPLPDPTRVTTTQPAVAP